MKSFFCVIGFLAHNKYFLSSCSSGLQYFALSPWWFQWISFHFSSLKFILNLCMFAFITSLFSYCLSLTLLFDFFFLLTPWLPSLSFSLFCGVLLLYSFTLLHVISSDFCFIPFHLFFNCFTFTTYLTHLLLFIIWPLGLPFTKKITSLALMPFFIPSVY